MQKESGFKRNKYLDAELNVINTGNAKFQLYPESIDFVVRRLPDLFVQTRGIRAIRVIRHNPHILFNVIRNNMKVLILAGGLGSRLSEETNLKPKPMVEIGGKPILWHIMKIYSSFGFNDFVILCGYKGYMIKSYFANYYRHMADMTVDMKNNSIEYHKSHSEPWKVTLINTGLDTMTGGRIKKVQEYVGNEPFMLTYGDGVGDIDIAKLVEYHKAHGKAITMTSVQPEGRYGSLVVNDQQQVTSFLEKPRGDGAWINAGFFVCQPEVFDYIPDGENVIFEREPLEGLARNGELITFKHNGFWKPMDTQRDKTQLEDLIEKGTAPWITW